MKHLSAAMLILVLAAAPGFAQYNYGHDDYSDAGDYNDAYLAYDYGYEAARPWLDRWDGPVYYWAHPGRDVYFVLIGPRVFVIPIYELSHIWYRLRWQLVAMDRFISLSCFGLPYYDNYVRFNYYSNHYRRYRYDRYRNSWLRSRYRSYFHNRYRYRDYYRDRGRVLNSRGWKNHRNYGYSLPRRRIVRDRLDTRRRTAGNSRTRYSSRRSGPARASARTSRSGHSRRTTVRRSNTRSSRSVRRSSRRTTSSRTVRRSRSSSRARSSRKARRR